MSQYVDYSQHLQPQSQRDRANVREVENSAGGFVYAVTKWDRLRRFLVLGAEGGSYYATERELVVENASSFKECLAEDYERAIREVVEVSESGVAPKNTPAIFCLAVAMAHGADIGVEKLSVGDRTKLDVVRNARVRAAAYAALPRVARTGTHLFELISAVNKLRGWGPGLRRAVARWYTERPADQVAYQMVKYQNRAGFTHKDVMALAHPKPPTAAHEALFRWVKWSNEAPLTAYVSASMADGFDVSHKKSKDILGIRWRNAPKLVRAYEVAKRTLPNASEHSKPRILQAIRGDLLDLESAKLTHEMIPTEWKNDRDVWAALLEKMPMEAMVRNLGKMSNVGLIAPLSDASKLIRDRLVDGEAVKQARLHPLKVLMALRTYESGHGERGSLTWTPDPMVTAALDEAFYLAFENVVPTNKNMVLALDVSGSMGCVLLGTSLTAREASAAMALVTMRTEPNCHVMAFGDRFHSINITKRDRLTDAVQKVSHLPFGATDCSLPMIWAQKEVKAKGIDAFVVYTDNETWSGREHPDEALRNYRRFSGRNAKLVVVGMVANAFTIADPNDPGMLDVVGFDASAPTVISDFVRA